jgi:hypothetical protein
MTLSKLLTFHLSLLIPEVIAREVIGREVIASEGFSSEVMRFKGVSLKKLQNRLIYIRNVQHFEIPCLIFKNLQSTFLNLN